MADSNNNIFNSTIKHDGGEITNTNEDNNGLEHKCQFSVNKLGCFDRVSDIRSTRFIMPSLWNSVRESESFMLPRMDNARDFSLLRTPRSCGRRIHGEKVDFASKSSDSSRKKGRREQSENLNRGILSGTGETHLEGFNVSVMPWNPANVLTDTSEVSVRFYLSLESDGEVRHDVKSVRIRRHTTVEAILPILRDKFRLQVVPGDIQVYSVTDTGELRLPPPAKPLDIVLLSDPAPRFVVRTGRHDVNAGWGYPHHDVTTSYQHNKSNYTNYCGNGNSMSGTGYIKNNSTQMSRDRIHQSAHTPDLVGDCRRKPIIPISDFKPLDDDLSIWARSAPTTMIGSDSNLNAILDNMSDSSLSLHDSLTSDTGRGRKKNRSGRPRRRTKSRESSVDSRDGEFKPISKRGSSLRTSRSMSSLFQKTFSLRKKDNPFQPKTELSTEESSPGILKIFGDNITPGANYKSVLAVSTSTSRELVKEALERYAIPKKRAGHYVLCDVIGHFMNYSSDLEASENKYSLAPENGLWTEECIRIIGDNERPLVLQKYWKPTEGYARRFELRRRSDLMIIEDKDTSGVNANARRMLTSKAKYEITQSSMDITSDTDSRDCYTDDEFIHRRNGYATRQQGRTDSDPILDDRRGERSRLKAPTTCPFLVNLQGYNTNQDSIIYPITHRCVKVGSDRKLVPRHVHLTAPDIQTRHCELRLSAKSDTPTKCLSTQTTGKRSFTFCVQIHIHEGADVSINGIPKRDRTLLQNGDVITLGAYYQFIYRDPCAPQIPLPNLAQRMCRTTDSNQAVVDHSRPSTEVPVTPPEVSLRDLHVNVTCNMTEEEKRSLQWRVRRNAHYENDHSRLKLSYSLEREDELLQTIMGLADIQSDTFRLTPAYLLSMAVDFSAAKHDQICTRTLLLKLATKIHNSVLRIARTLAEKQASQCQSLCLTTTQLYADMGPIIQWMSNALELAHHFRQHLTDYLMDPQVSLSTQSRASISTAGDEVIGTLDEVVMYTFQQTVYYLTKALYVCLPAITECNPFHDDARSDSSNGKPTIDHVITIFQLTLDYLRDYKLHKNVISQLFCYLMFFTNTSVFNNLMSKGSSDKYFRWSRGVQLRGNLDSLEAWAVRNNFSHEATTYLRKLTCLTNLLSSPKVQLIKSSWTTLRESFSDLNATQLHHVLKNYEDGKFADIWQPTGEDTDALHNVDLTESFSGHPPLLFPTDGYQLDLSSDNRNQDFYRILNDINAKFGTGDDDVDSGLSISQNSNNELHRLVAPVCDGGSSPHQSHKRPNSQPESSNSSYLSSPVCLTSSGELSGLRDTPVSCVLKRSDSPPSRPVSGDKHRSDDVMPPKTILPDPVTDYARMSSPRIRSSVSPTDSHRSFRPISSDNDSRSSISRSQRTPCRRDDKLSQYRYSYGTRQSASFSHHQPERVPVVNYETHPKNTCKGEIALEGHDNGIRKPASFSYHYKAGDQRGKQSSNRESSCIPNQQSKTLYTNSSTKHLDQRDVSASLNSSMSSQISRDGNEVYQYMRDSLGNVDGESEPSELSQPDDAPHRQCTPAPASQQLEEYRIDHLITDTNRVSDNEIYVDAISPITRQNDLYVLSDSSRHRRNPASPERLQTFKGSVGDGSSQSLDVAPSPIPHSSLLTTIHNRQKSLDELAEDDNDVFMVELSRGPMGFGMGLIDGLHTPLHQLGIYVRTVVAGSPAHLDGRLQLGDRILEVNGSRVVGADYPSVMQSIKDAGDLVKLKMVHSGSRVVMQITSSPC